MAVPSSRRQLRCLLRMRTEDAFPCRSPLHRSERHPAGPHDRGAGRGGRHPGGLRFRATTRSSRRASTCGSATVAYRVRASFLPGPRTTVAERIDDLKLHEIALADGAVLETGCVYIVPLIESLALPRRHRGRRQSEELDRPARRLHPRHRRRDPRLRPDQRRLPRPALCRDQPAHLSGAGARGLAPVADPLPARQLRCSTPRRCATLHARERLVNDDDADVGDGVAVERRSVAGGGERGNRGWHRRLSRQAPHRGDRRRPARRLRRRRFLGADPQRARTAA